MDEAGEQWGDELPAWLVEVGEVLADDRLAAQIKATGGCANPVHLVGESVVINAGTGEVLHSYSTADEPFGKVLIACGNRRASVCPSCSEVYRADVFQLIRAGLSGGKGVSEEVSQHPRVFVTLTAPSFGPVHTRRETNGRTRPCRPRRDAAICEHGRPHGCLERHGPGAEALGQPICADCYDYLGAVLWQAHASVLWDRFATTLRRELAKHAGLSRRTFNRSTKVSFAKVAEYQRRGLVHFHALVRLDGADGANSSPPPWATHDLLMRAVPAAGHQVEVATPASDLGARVLRWGEQIDVRPLLVLNDRDGFDEQKVAGYIAKYATKGAEASGTIDYRLSCGQCRGTGLAGSTACKRCAGLGLKEGLDLERLPVTEHARRMIRTCWTLGNRPEFADLRLRQWAHMLGFRGHFTTKSRRYSTTLGLLRSVRTEYRAEQAREHHGLPDPAEQSTQVLAHWRFAGQGYTRAQAIVADGISQRVQTARRIKAARGEECA